MALRLVRWLSQPLPISTRFSTAHSQDNRAHRGARANMEFTNSVISLRGVGLVVLCHSTASGTDGSPRAGIVASGRVAAPSIFAGMVGDHLAEVRRRHHVAKYSCKSGDSRLRTRKFLHAFLPPEACHSDSNRRAIDRTKAARVRENPDHRSRQRLPQ